ncbi:hypothetical protein, partial [Mesomycoplasma hyorhinis]
MCSWSFEVFELSVPLLVLDPEAESACPLDSVVEPVSVVELVPEVESACPLDSVVEPVSVVELVP